MKYEYEAAFELAPFITIYAQTIHMHVLYYSKVNSDNLNSIVPKINFSNPNGTVILANAES